MADTAEKPVKSLAERQRDAMIGTEETIQRFKELGVGVLKAVTTDLPGFLMDVADKLAGDTATLGEKDRSAQLFKSITGIESKGTNAELLGSMLGPESAVKAMVVGAVRAAKVGSKAVDLPKAEQMIAEGLPADRIFRETGVYKDTDFNRKAVISDAKMRIDPTALMGIKWFQYPPVHLDSVVVHPELFKLYPELGTVQVLRQMGLPGEAGYSPRKTESGVGQLSIVLPNKIEDLNRDQVRGSMLHEIQHAIQNIEGFQRGGSPQSFEKFSRGAIPKLQEAFKSPDSAIRTAAQKMSDRYNQQAIDAYNRYQALPGEQEARFTEATRNLSQSELDDELTRRLGLGKTPSKQK